MEGEVEEDASGRGRRVVLRTENAKKKGYQLFLISEKSRTDR